MDRLRKIASFWNWLPAFRAVAESQHLPTASKHLLVTAPALSRSIRLLERELGQPLFRRSGRRIELNEAGEKFLGAVRDAMRLIHEGMLEVKSEQLVGTLRIASAGLVTQYVIPALTELQDENDNLVPWLTTAVPAEIPNQLMRGELDVAFVCIPMADDRLSIQHIGSATNGIYCGEKHALRDRAELTIEEVVEHSFIAPVPAVDGQTKEGWPPAITRRIAMHVDQMRLGVDICARGELLAVFPDSVARAHPDAQLHRLPVDVLPTTDIFAAMRPALGRQNSAAMVIDAVARQISAAQAPC